MKNSNIWRILYLCGVITDIFKIIQIFNGRIYVRHVFLWQGVECRRMFLMVSIIAFQVSTLFKQMRPLEYPVSFFLGGDRSRRYTYKVDPYLELKHMQSQNKPNAPCEGTRAIFTKAFAT